MHLGGWSADLWMRETDLVRTQQRRCVYTCRCWFEMLASIDHVQVSGVLCLLLFVTCFKTMKTYVTLRNDAGVVWRRRDGDDVVCTG